MEGMTGKVYILLKNTVICWTYTPMLPVLYYMLKTKMLNHPGASLQIVFGMPTQTCSYSSSQTTMATLAWAKLHSQTMS